MAPPHLNRRLVLEARVEEPDGAGGMRHGWTEVGTLWAELGAGTAGERNAGPASLSSVRYRITVRAAPHGAPARPVPAQRFRDGARRFRIVAVRERGQDGRYLDCETREEVSS